MSIGNSCCCFNFGYFQSETKGHFEIIHDIDKAAIANTREIRFARKCAAIIETETLTSSPDASFRLNNNALGILDYAKIVLTFRRGILDFATSPFILNTTQNQASI